LSNDGISIWGLYGTSDNNVIVNIFFEVENYYSTSLKRHRKKQIRSDRGIENQMKLSAMKRVGLLGKCEKTLLEAFLIFVPFLDHW